MTNPEIDAVIAGLSHDARAVILAAPMQMPVVGWHLAQTAGVRRQKIAAMVMSGMLTRHWGAARLTEYRLSKLGLAVRAKLTNQPETK